METQRKKGVIMKIVIAFPGLGKTTLAREGKVSDIDFGQWRKMSYENWSKLTRSQKRELLREFYAYLKQEYANSVVLTNEIALLSISEARDDISFTCVPHDSFYPEWIGNLVKRDCLKKSSYAFLRDCITFSFSWHTSWRKQATDVGVKSIMIKSYEDFRTHVMAIKA